MTYKVSDPDTCEEFQEVIERYQQRKYPKRELELTLGGDNSLKFILNLPFCDTKRTNLACSLVYKVYKKELVKTEYFLVGGTSAYCNVSIPAFVKGTMPFSVREKTIKELPEGGEFVLVIHTVIEDLRDRHIIKLDESDESDDDNDALIRLYKEKMEVLCNYPLYGSKEAGEYGLCVFYRKVVKDNRLLPDEVVEPKMKRAKTTTTRFVDKTLLFQQR